MRVSRALTFAAVAALTLGLTACTADRDRTTPDEASPVTAETPEPEATEEADPGSADGGSPEWAHPVTTPGEKITTITVGDVTVDVYQVGVTKATEAGFFVDPETNEPIIAEGDDIVFVNYVITNTGEPVNLSASLVEASGTYDDWKYLQAMDSVVDRDLFEAQGVNMNELAPGGYVESNVYTLGTGQSFSYGENFRYQPGSPITFEAQYIQVDAEGELLHDTAVEAEDTGTIS